MSGSFAQAHRSFFHTDRGTDLTLLGAAFQRGLIPLTLDALAASLDAIEQADVGQARDAFELGRRLACDEQLFAPPVVDVEESLESLVRRLTLAVSRTTWGGNQTAGNFRRLIDRTLASMAALADTQDGRLAQVELVLALYRCLLWDGSRYAERFAELLLTIYKNDRAERSWQFTRVAILPLAEAMLIRDVFYVASITASSEHRLWLRRMLNLKHARGDQMQRRYLTRFELYAFHRRFRLDGRTSDWITALGSRMAFFLPRRWRGTRREREVREAVIAYLVRLSGELAEHYEQHVTDAQRLHELARTGRLRTISPDELALLLNEKPAESRAPIQSAASSVS
jgi:hypothetical protein